MLIYMLAFGVTSMAMVAGADSYPEVARHGMDSTQFVPAGWKVLASAKGDLNRDKIDDYALVLESDDSLVVEGYEGGEENDGEETPTYHPRMLVVALYNNATNRYERIEQSNTFIMEHDNPDMDEPFSEIEIAKGVLNISFNIFMSSGGWETTNATYRFRYQDAELALIGADHMVVNRGSGETSSHSYNFLTKKVEIATGSISDDKETKRTRKFSLDRLRTIRTFKKPFSWEIEPDVTL